MDEGKMMRAWRTIWTVVLLAAWAAGAAGCAGMWHASGGDLTLQSHQPRDPAAATGGQVTGGKLAGNFGRAYYRLGDADGVTVVLIDGPEDAPTRAVTLHLLWQPRAGDTPLDEHATNVTVRYVIFTGDAQAPAGVYGGAGYLYPHDDLGDGSVRFSLWDSSLRLVDRSPGFADRLGLCTLQGDVDATRDDAKTLQLVQAIEQRLLRSLGYPAMVMAR